jgi:hypothetical protein
LQGLLHWLASLGLEHVIPFDGEGVATRKMNRFIGTSILTIILLMISFYNGQMTFYKNYWEMLKRYAVVAWVRYFWRWPPRPMSFITGPMILISAYFGWDAFQEIHIDIDDDDDEISRGEL